MIEPPVEPADPPTNMSAKSVSTRRDGQSAKSVVAIPVVVMIETTWKIAWPDGRLALRDARIPRA